ncbi:MAG: hypothetical protein R3F60_27690 [bacterium]
MDISPDDSRVAMVNADNGSLSVFSVGTAGSEARTAVVPTSASPEPEPSPS